MSPELETLDQLLGGDLRVSVVRGLFGDISTFQRAVEAMLGEGEVCLMDNPGAQVPTWRWREILSNADDTTAMNFFLPITKVGVHRID